MKYLLLSLGLMFFTSTEAHALYKPTQFRISADQSSMIVVGNGEIKAMPDLAFVLTNVVTKAKTAKEAQALNAATTKRLVDALVAKFNLDKNTDISTSSYNVSPDYQENSTILIGYQVKHSLTIKIKDFNLLGSVIDASADSGGIVDSVQFGLSNKKPFESEALKAAMADATQRARTIAEANGRPLGRLVKVSELSYNYEAPTHSMAAAEASSATEIYPDQITVSATLTVEYEF